jgi:hypothetical protein
VEAAAPGSWGLMVTCTHPQKKRVAIRRAMAEIPVRFMKTADLFPARICFLAFFMYKVKISKKRNAQKGTNSNSKR